MSGAIGNPAEPPERLHGFDAVRGLAAVAVVALHAAYPYIVAPMPGLVWTVPVDDPSWLCDTVFWWIEGCVMPLFFTLSGYFLARSIARQSAREFLAGRTRRLLLPMATIGLAVLTLDLQVWAYGLISTGRATFGQYLRFRYHPDIQANLWGPAHMWYVEYLWLMCLAIGVGMAVVGRLRSKSGAGKPWKPNRLTTLLGVAVLVAAVAVVLVRHPEIVLGFQHGWRPSPPKFVHAALFLSLGILVARSRGFSARIRTLAPLMLLVAVSCFVVLLPRLREVLLAGQASEANLELGLLLAAFAFSATLGQLGAGLRWLDRPNPRLAWLAAASFWVYLLHHPVLGLLQVLLRPVAMPAEAKFAIVLAITMVVCLGSYRLFVENRGIGRLLDGELPWKAFRQAEPSIVQLPEPARLRRAA